MIKRRVWPRESSSAAQVERALCQTDHYPVIARDDAGQVVGFADSFPTRTAEGHLRWELDLLAVDPACQGQRIGQRLIQAATDAGFQNGAAVARALVQIDNRASQGAFHRCGYRLDSRVFQLLISTRPVEPGDTPLERAALIPVTTMNYTGLWLEGAIDATGLQTAQTAQTQAGVDLVGTLLPVDAGDLIAEAEALGFEPVEQFQWWLHPRP